ncbi:hypothetical protein DXG03_006623, partial [Asterophora parasitica]
MTNFGGQSGNNATESSRKDIEPNASRPSNSGVDGKAGEGAGDTERQRDGGEDEGM